MSRAELVRKLQQHAESARKCGSEAEAAAFAAKAAQIAAQEGLTPEDLQQPSEMAVREPHPEDRYSRRHGTGWCRYSATQLAEYLGLECFTFKPLTEVIHLFGLQSDIEAAQPVLGAFVWAVHRACRARGIDALQSFERGVSIGIYERVELQRMQHPRQPGLLRLNMAHRLAGEELKRRAKLQVRSLKDHQPSNADAFRAGRKWGRDQHVPTRGAQS
jgi:hypothetical protein